MCGIAGIAAFEGPPVDRDQLTAMAQALAHRGPDGEGLYLAPDGRAGFGFRRLAIIDLPGGAQPMCNETHDIWAIFNGEIYNYRDLRAELLAAGHRFSTDSDTETLLHGYEEWGPDLVKHLRGMFAFAIWDERTGTLLLARDRVGKKPLFYYCDGRRVAFASELKGLLAVPWVPRSIDLAALGQYLAFGYVPAPRTIYQGVHKLEPGSVLVARADSQWSSRYWDLPAPGQKPAYKSFEEALDGVDRRLNEAVAMRLHADVPLGAFLSGGIDSSLIVALMTRHFPRRVQTFSIGFFDEAISELRYAEQVARHLGTDHHVDVVRPDVQGLLWELTRHFDEPFADSSMIPTYVLAKMTRQHVTVALSGDGGDEAFAGYDHYRNFLLARTLGRLPGARLGAWAVATLLPTGMAGDNLAERIAASEPHRYASTMSLLSSRLRQGLVRPELRSAIRAGVDEAIRAIYGSQDFTLGDPMAAAQRVDITRGYLHGDILCKVDMTSMAHSLEVRAPFLDHVLIEEAVELPRHYKATDGTGKLLLRTLAARYLPQAIIERKKHGFIAPVSDWLRTSLRPLVREVLCDERARVAEFLDPRIVQALVRRHLDGLTDRPSRIFLLLALELWLRQAEPARAAA